MAQHANQHFVPKFYFRRFSGGKDCINLCLMPTGGTIPNASIRGQCAGHRFYGSPELEHQLNQLEGTHAHALRVIADAAWKSDWSKLTPDVFGSLLEAVLFQRTRTALEFEKSKELPNAMWMPAFRAYIATAAGVKHRERILDAIDRGELKIVGSRAHTLLQHMQTAMECAPLIADLDFCVLRNYTDYPFVFSDSPVVFYNTLMRNVTSRGVLGFQSPGLEIFFPLGPNMVLMFYDDKAYQLSHNGCIDVTERSDVSQLNALQFKHSLNAVYFGDWGAREYVADLWAAHGRNHRSPSDEYGELHGAVVDGNPLDDQVMHMFEPHLDFRLGLSFVSCQPMPDNGRFPGYRSLDLYEEHRRRTGDTKSR